MTITHACVDDQLTGHAWATAVYELPKFRDRIASGSYESQHRHGVHASVNLIITDLRGTGSTVRVGTTSYQLRSKYFNTTAAAQICRQTSIEALGDEIQGHRR